MQYALLAGVLASVACGVIGTYIVVRRITYIAGGIAHCVLGGLGAAVYLQKVHGWTWLHPLFGAVAAALAAALIIGLAGPVLNPEKQQSGRGPLLIVMDASWASGRTWRDKTRLIEGLLDEAGRNGRPLAILRMTAPEPLVFQAVNDWKARLGGLEPLPWEANMEMTQQVIADLGAQRFETYWMSDGLSRDSRAPLLADLLER